MKADVERAIAAGPAPAAAPSLAPARPPPSADERPETAKGQASHQELTKLQQTVARRMAESKATAPHFYLQVEVDMSRCVEARRRIKEAAAEGQSVPSLNDMVVKAAAIALREHPRANGAYRDGRLELYSRINVGVAVAAQDALVVPTVFDADRKGLQQIAEEVRALAQRVRDGTVTPPELSGGTFTVSNLGMFGIDSFAAVINPPQAGILAVGAITERPVVREGEIVVAAGHDPQPGLRPSNPLWSRRRPVPRPHPQRAHRAPRLGAVARLPTSIAGDPRRWPSTLPKGIAPTFSLATSCMRRRIG